jgi:hypothetical protein
MLISLSLLKEECYVAPSDAVNEPGIARIELDE